jgi:FMN phosphatase YigB (HAD superfamily)
MKSIIFDLDDTLYASKELRGRREKALLDFLGRKAEKYTELRKTHTTLQSLSLLGISKEKFFDIMESIQINLKKDLMLRRMLNKLSSDYELIVLSNSSSLCVIETLKKLGVLDLFDRYYGGDCFKNTKPHEECFSMVKKGDICVGNNFKKDLLMPKKKAAVTVLVSNEKSSDADFTIKNIYELSKVIKKLK